MQYNRFTFIFTSTVILDDIYGGYFNYTSNYSNKLENYIFR